MQSFIDFCRVNERATTTTDAILFLSLLCTKEYIYIYTSSSIYFVEELLMSFFFLHKSKNPQIERERESFLCGANPRDLMVTHWVILFCSTNFSVYIIYLLLYSPRTYTQIHREREKLCKCPAWLFIYAPARRIDDLLSLHTARDSSTCVLLLLLLGKSV